VKSKNFLEFFFEYGDGKGIQCQAVPGIMEVNLKSILSVESAVFLLLALLSFNGALDFSSVLNWPIHLFLCHSALIQFINIFCGFTFHHLQA
jgi:hypothetical protein